jgi:hypothetical protein
VSGDDKQNRKKIEVDMKDDTKVKLQAFGYTGKEFLMNVSTGSVCSSEEWLCDSEGWFKEEESVENQFSSLVEVRKDSNGDWLEV